MLPGNRKSFVYAGILVENSEEGKRLVGNLAVAAIAPVGLDRTRTPEDRPPSPIAQCGALLVGRPP
jgi:hypothetical protein